MKTDRNTQRKTNLQELREEFQKLMAQGDETSAIDMLFAALESMMEQNDSLSDLIGAMQKRLYGRRTEKIDPQQLEICFDLLADASSKKLLDNTPAPAVQAAPTPEKCKKGHGRKPLPADLPRETVDIVPPAEELHCHECGVDKKEIGAETSTTLDWIPGHFVVREFRRIKMVCPLCEGGLVIAPTPYKVIAKGLPGTGLLSQVLINKYKDSLPLNRQMEIFARHGVELASATLSDWVGFASELLQPIYEEICQQVMGAHVLSTDDTGLTVMDQNNAKGSKKGYLWAYVGDNRAVAFDYTPDRKASGPASFMEKRSGIIQSDGYAGYDRIAKDNPNVLRAGCMAHARRKFKEAMDAGDVLASSPINAINRLYDIERQARDNGWTYEQLLEARQGQGQKIMDGLEVWLRDMKPKIPPKTPLGKAITYADNQWPYLSLFLTDGRIPIDNNHVERQMRQIAVGRKNYLFAGSDRGAQRAAIIYSIMGTCTLVGVEPFAYLKDVLDKLSQEWPTPRMQELLPEQWAKNNEQPVEPTTDHNTELQT